MRLPFLAQLIKSTKPEELIWRLRHTAFDELMEIDLSNDQYQMLFHADGKFFTPVSDSRYSQLFRYSSENMVHPEDRGRHDALMRADHILEHMRQAQIPGVLMDELRYIALDGNWHWMLHLLISGTQYGIPDNHVYVYMYDIQEMEDREHGQDPKIQYSAERLLDRMPGIRAERMFFSLAQELYPRLKGSWCLIAVDIKHFKLFKELNGAKKGDDLLIRCAAVLVDLADRTGGLAGYRGQDDFCLMVPFDHSLVEKLFDSLHRIIDELSSTSGFYPILGISMMDDPGMSVVDLFNRAALTAEEIKDDLQYHIRVYDPETHHRRVEEFRLLSEFHEALRSGSIYFALQPQCRVATLQIVGAESLARWQRKDGSYVSPAIFVPILEKYGIVTELDRYIWESVCRWLKENLDAGRKVVPISLNVSRIDIFSMDVPMVLSEYVRRYQIPVRLIKIEITESAYVDDAERVKKTISDLQQQGFQVLMDDFGSGYSSLNMLRSINVDIIKLDAQFLRFNLGEEQKGINILESVINLTKTLGTPMIVEGVESPELAHYLADMGCQYMQGFHYYRPISPAEFERLLAEPGKVDEKGIVMQMNQQIHTREFLDDNIFSDAMLNNILGPVAFYQQKGENIDIIRYNQQFVSLIGLEGDVMEERRYHIQDYFFPEDRQKMLDLLARARKDRLNGASGQVRVYKPNSMLFWMDLRVYYLKEDQSGYIYYASARDMTELQYINVDLPGGYYRCRLDDGLEFLYLSSTFLKMFGYTRDEIRAQFQDRLINMVHPLDRKRILEQAHSLLKGEDTRFMPYRVLARDGTYRYVADQSRLTEQLGPVCWQSVMIDITEVMTLRNRMRVLEKYSADSIIFLRKATADRPLEVAVYGMEEALEMNQAEFEQALLDGSFFAALSGGEPLSLAKIRAKGIPWSECRYQYTARSGKQRTLQIRLNSVNRADESLQYILNIAVG